MTITYENPIGFLKNEAEIINIAVHETFVHITLKGSNTPATIGLHFNINEIAKLVTALNYKPEN